MLTSQADVRSLKMADKLNFGRFKTLIDQDEEELLSKKKAKSTNDATRLWMKVFIEYLDEKGYPKLEAITNDKLVNILSDLYGEIRKKKTDENGDLDSCN